MRKEKKMKPSKAAVLFLGAALVAVWAAPSLLAHGPRGWRQAQAGPFYEQMEGFRDIMHEATINSEEVAQGVKVTLTGEEPALVEAIKARFGAGAALTAPYPGVEVAAEEVEQGVVLTFTAGQAEAIAWLKNRGEEVAFDLLRESMHGLMAAQGFTPGQGPGQFRGGPGYGSMHGRGGPGQGWMHGQGGRGGPGYGWMHGQGGPGFGQGPGPGGSFEPEKPELD